MAQGATTVLAFDLGATSGRAILGSLESGRLEFREIHRFPNEPVRYNGEVHWDLPRLWYEMQAGLRLAAQTGGPLASVGLDTWGVDYALLGEGGVLLDNPYTYRDQRTQGMIERGQPHRGSRPDLPDHRHSVHGLQHALPAPGGRAQDAPVAGHRGGIRSPCRTCSTTG